MSRKPVNVDYRALMQKALVKLEKMQTKLNALERAKNEPIAIIGMACRFPGGADTPQKFWQLLRDGVDAISEVPKSRWDIDAYYDPDPDAPGKMSTRFGGFLADVEHFAPQFFGISPREALTLDPQQRLLLEVTWEALENANQVPEENPATGVFIGIANSDYAKVLAVAPEGMSAYAGTGTTLSVAAGRLSYTLEFMGPCMAIDTACSSSLVAIHLACQSLRQQECEIALAGGVNLILTPDVNVVFSKARMMAPDGRCKTFDAAANGYVRSEGCAVMALKRLSDAVASGDNILALIRGSAINQDGASGGLTVPSGPSQEAVIRQALANGGINPAEVSYIEAHGTGTSLGDPIEIGALHATYGKKRESGAAPLLVGSVKTNVGHLEAVAGIAGVMKAVLALQHDEIPPNLHLNELNPHIAWEEMPIQVVTERTPWPTKRRLAGVSSFGFSGTNAHIVLEAAKQTTSHRGPSSAKRRRGSKKPLERPLHLLTLSTVNAAEVKALAERYGQHLAANPSLSFSDICFTANTARSSFKHRLALVAGSSKEAREKLAAFCAGDAESVRGVRVGQVPNREAKIAFLFTGQGAEYVEMGRQLYETQPIFRQTLQRCDEILQDDLYGPSGPYSLLDVLYPSRHASVAPKAGQTSPLDQVAYTQPALFAFEYALFELWTSWGIEPSIVMGHSTGEYVAACVAGVFSLEDGLKLMAARGRLMQSLAPDGEMVAVLANETQIKTLLQPFSDEVSIGVINGPESIVISGRDNAIEQVIASLSAEGIKTKKLNIPLASHSPLVEPILADLEAVLRGVTLSPPKMSIMSNRTGKVAGEEMATPQYWSRHMRQPVRFVDSIRAMSQQGVDIFVELGPKSTLLGMGQLCLPDAKLEWLPSLGRDGEDWLQLLSSLGALYVNGVPIDWEGFEREYPKRTLVELPTYAWQRERYWVETIDPSLIPQHFLLNGHYHRLLGQRLRLPYSKEIRFESELNPLILPYLDHHRLYGTMVVPAASHMSMVLSAVKELFGQDACQMTSFLVPQALTLSDNEPRAIQLVLKQKERAERDSQRAPDFSFEVISLREGEEPNEEGSWGLYATADLTLSLPPQPEPIVIEEVQARCPAMISGSGLSSVTFTGGPSFQWIETSWFAEEEALGKIKTPTLEEEIGDYQLHPGLIDAGFLLLTDLAIRQLDESAGPTYVLFSVATLTIYQLPAAGSQLWYRAQIKKPAQPNPQRISGGSISLLDEKGTCLVEISGVEIRTSNRQALMGGLNKQLKSWLYEVAWQRSNDARSSGSLTTSQKSWLIFADQQGVARQLARTLSDTSPADDCLDCVLVFAGPSYRQLEPNHYQLNPADASEYERLLSELDFAPDGIIHLWGTDEVVGDTLQNGLVSGCGSLLYLVQALAHTNMRTRLWVVTQGAMACPSSIAANKGPLQVQQAPLWGLGRVIAQEHPDLQPVLIDLDPSATSDFDFRASVQALANELRLPDLATPRLRGAQAWREKQVAYREGERYVARLVRATLASTAEEERSDEKEEAEDNNSYLITGGLGGLGLKVAAFLVELGVRHLVLSGRSGASPSAQAVIDQLQEAGAQIQVIKADVSSLADMSRLFEEAFTETRLRGVIHAAGILDDGVLLQQTPARFEKVMAAKVSGAWNLHTLTQDLPLDFFVCFSSTTSILGPPAQGNHAAANAFMDALAHHRHALGLPALSINWGAWSEVGLAAQRMRDNKMSSQNSISPEQGITLLAELLGQKVAQIAVLPTDWDAFFAQFEGNLNNPFLEAFKPESTSADSAEQAFLHQLEKAPIGERRGLLTTHVHDHVATVLGSREAIDPNQGFFDMGMDSLMSVELRNRLQSSLECWLPATLAFKYSTVLDLTNHLIEEVLALEFTDIEAEAATETLEEEEQEEELDTLSPDELAELLALELLESGD